MSSKYVDRSWQGHNFILPIVLVTMVVVACTDRFDLPEPVAAPTNLVATAIYENGFALAWQDNSDNESSFYISYDLGYGWESVAPAKFVSANDTALFFGLIIPDREYKFRVYAFRGPAPASFSEYSNTLIVSPLPFTGQPPSIPFNLVINPTNMHESDFEAELSWSVSANDTVTDRIDVHFSTDVVSGWISQGSSGGTSAFSGLRRDVLYSFRVYSVDLGNRVRSDYSQVVTLFVSN